MERELIGLDACFLQLSSISRPGSFWKNAGSIRRIKLAPKWLLCSVSMHASTQIVLVLSSGRTDQIGR
jgi:hypothetical protein